MGRCLDAEQSGKYNVLFVGSRARLEGIFVGWRSPQAPRTKLRRNPFTGQQQEVQTTEPDDTDGGPASGEWDLRTAEVPQDAGYDGYLESRIPPQIRRLPHLRAKRIIFEMMAVSEVMSGKGDLREALFPPSGCTTSLPVLEVPDAVTSALRKMNDVDAAKLAGRLAKHDAFTDWGGVADVERFVADLRALVRAAPMSDGLYILPV